jgi:hypothetical protein
MKNVHLCLHRCVEGLIYLYILVSLLRSIPALLNLHFEHCVPEHHPVRTREIPLVCRSNFKVSKTFARFKGLTPREYEYGRTLDYNSTKKKLRVYISCGVKHNHLATAPEEIQGRDPLALTHNY